MTNWGLGLIVGFCVGFFVGYMKGRWHEHQVLTHHNRKEVERERA